MRRTTTALVLLASFAAIACDADESPSTEPTQDGASGAKADAIDETEHPPTIECRGVRSGISFDLAIDDVGDETGFVYVQDAGAEAARTQFEAVYDESPDEAGNVGHFFIFGFDEDGTAEELHSVEVHSISHSLLLGEVTYKGNEESIVCYDLEKTRDPETQPDFECVSPTSEVMFDLDIVSAKEFEGSVVVNDGGAPLTFDDANYIGPRADDPERKGHRFVFGFEQQFTDAIHVLHEVIVEDVDTNFAVGTASYTPTPAPEDSDPTIFDLVCYQKNSEEGK